MRTARLPTVRVSAAATNCGQNSWHTLLKILPCPNFVAGGNKGVHHIYAKMQCNVLNVYRKANNYIANVSACKTISFCTMKSVGLFSFATARTCQWIPLLEGITLFHTSSNRFRPDLLSDIIDTISCTVTDIVHDGSERSRLKLKYLLSNVNFHHSFFFYRCN